ncbi:hypothetical protein Q3G72_006970 [Acer saccharum]|nr:hypothetical protein Q3G72_006970 [Acer saccharum]
MSNDFAMITIRTWFTIAMSRTMWIAVGELIWDVVGVLIWDLVFAGIAIVNWINSDYFRSLEHIQMVYDIRESMRTHGNISVTYCSQSSNSYADDLAKKGSNMVGDVMHWSSI